MLGGYREQPVLRGVRKGLYQQRALQNLSVASRNQDCWV